MNCLTLAISIYLAILMSLVYCYDPTDYKSLIATLADDDLVVKDYAQNVQTLLSAEPNYFNYTPFASIADYSFHCDPAMFKSEQQPKSVHKLRPGDIRVVSAMGDSLTAAVGAKARTILGELIEYRGRSWSIGGQYELEKIVSLPNILKKFNPELIGFSKITDDSLTFSHGRGLNVAISGSFSSDMAGQAHQLVSNLKRAKYVDFENDWKLITLFIGGNDLCLSCQDTDYYSPVNYVENLREALDHLHMNVPRAFVNLVQVVNITALKEMNRGLFCSLVHWVLCPCGGYPRTAEDVDQVKNFTREYRRLTEQLIESGRYDTYDDFTVVIQPLYTDLQPARLPNHSIDYTYLAPDCFHFSTKGHGSSYFFQLN